LERDATLLQASDMVLVHSERLLPVLRSYCDNVHFVEHHARFALEKMSEYKDVGPVLWIGGCQYVPYLLKWLEQHPIDHEVRILTDIDAFGARHAARRIADDIGLPLRLSGSTTSIAGHRVERWTEWAQAEAMRDCRAALDVKMTGNFNQDHKPPAKAQQYVASGIPFAVNPGAGTAEYFRLRGLELASPSDTGRWLSYEYWDETRAWAKQLRAWTSLENVGSRYRRLIESLWADSPQS
jgi:hypothetical protein